MTDWTLPKQIQEELGRWILEGGLSPQEFDLIASLSQRTQNTRINKLIHRATGARFVFDTHPQGGYFVEFAPAQGAPFGTEYSGGWSYVTPHLHSWLDRVKREAAANSPWDVYAEASNFANIGSGSHNEAFSASEREQVVAALEEVKLLIAESSSLTGDRLAALNASIDQLAEASSRVGKKDWILMVVGWGVSTAFDKGIQSFLLADIFRLLSERLHTTLAALKTIAALYGLVQ